MRDLTEEEINSAPEWATHYLIYYGGDICFEGIHKRALYSTKLRCIVKEEPSTGIRKACEALPEMRVTLDVTGEDLL